MTMEVDIGLQGRCQFGALNGLILNGLCAELLPSDFAGGQPAFMRLDLAVPSDRDIDLAAGLLADLFVFPALEILPPDP